MRVYLVSCQGSNNGQPGVSFVESLRYKKPYVAMAMRVFCALTFHKIYDRLTHHLSLDTTLGVSMLENDIQKSTPCSTGCFSGRPGSRNCSFMLRSIVKLSAVIGVSSILFSNGS